MPAEQRGHVYKTAKGFGIQWRDETRHQEAPCGLLVPLRGSDVVLGRRAEADARGARLPHAAHPRRARRRVPRAARRRGEHDPRAPRPAEARDRRDPREAACEGARARPRRDPRRPARRPHRRRVAEATPRWVGVARAQGAPPGARIRGAGEACRRERRAAVPNPEPKRREAPVFGAWEELDRLAGELPPAARIAADPRRRAQGCVRRNGSRSRGATSISRPACCTSGGSTPTAR